MKRHIFLSSLVFAVVGCGGSSTTSDPVPDKPSPPTVTLPGQPNDGLAPISQSEPDASEHLSGGEVTSNVFNEDAFSQSAPTIRPKNGRSAAILRSAQGQFCCRTPNAQGTNMRSER